MSAAVLDGMQFRLKTSPQRRGVLHAARVKFRWKVSLRGSSPFTLETSARRPRGGAGAPAHLAAARPGGRGGGGAGGGRGGAGCALPWAARQVGPRPGSSLPRSREQSWEGGVVASQRSARLSHPLTHGRKVALKPSPSSYFLLRAWLFVELEPGVEEPTPHTTRCPARVAARGPASPGRRHKLFCCLGILVRRVPHFEGGGAGSADRYVACCSELCV